MTGPVLLACALGSLFTLRSEPRATRAVRVERMNTMLSEIPGLRAIASWLPRNILPKASPRPPDEAKLGRADRKALDGLRKHLGSMFPGQFQRIVVWPPRNSALYPEFRIVVGTLDPNESRPIGATALSFLRAARCRADVRVVPSSETAAAAAKEVTRLIVDAYAKHGIVWDRPEPVVERYFEQPDNQRLYVREHPRADRLTLDGVIAMARQAARASTKPYLVDLIGEPYSTIR